jgi:hypothetical protein
MRLQDRATARACIKAVPTWTREPRRPSMNLATQLDLVMRIIWGDEEEHSPATVALASYVKNHARRNPENVFEVIDILYPKQVRAMTQRDENGHHNPLTGNEFCVDVQFDDDSQILVVCRNGIGHGLEFIS